MNHKQAAARLGISAELAKRVRKGNILARKSQYRTFQRGSLFKRGKRNPAWIGRWWETFIGTQGRGRVRKAAVLGFVKDLTRTAAAQALTERLRAINAGDHKPRIERTFSDFVGGEWASTIPATLKVSTQGHYEYLLQTHLIPMFGEMSLAEISREEIQQFIAAKLDSGLSWKTVKHLRSALGRVLGTALEWGFIDSNEVLKTKMPRRISRPRRQTIAASSIRALLKVLPEPSRSIMMMLTMTGLRIGELLALRWSSVDLRSRMIYVRESVYEGHFDSPKTERSNREVTLGPKVVAMLRARRRTVPGEEALVFASQTGTALSRRNLLQRQLKPAAKKLGIMGVTWHALRHCNATAHDSAGTPLGTVQALLGHSSPEITRGTYIHAVPSDAKKAAARVERRIMGRQFGPKLDPSRKGKKTRSA